MTYFGSHMLDGYGIGATLYMPVTHPKVPDIVFGRLKSPAATIVLCLEDSLSASDVEAGLLVLSRLLAEQPETAIAGPRLFIRPRSFDMACRLRAMPGIVRIEGFVAPKVRLETLPDWISLLSGTTLKLMPTMETPDFFDPARLIQFRDTLLATGHERIAAVRIGGNDLLGSMGLRRVRGVTSYEGPLGWFLSMAASILIPAGVPVAAPVFDIIEDMETLKREVERDVQMGFISKTAIHPTQVGIIESAFAACKKDFCAAKAILDPDSSAVFQLGGVMCEPATHAAWARRVQARAETFGFA